MFRLTASLILLTALSVGCAGIEAPGPEQILPPWSGAAPVRLGENKDSVRDKWGEPDEIKQLGADDVGLLKEEWLYRGRYPVPVDYQYLSKTKRLIFTGDNLTGFEAGEQPQTRTEE